MSIYPTLRYDNAATAVAFLTDALGLTAENVTRTDDGSVEHAELSWHGGVIMIGDRPDPPGPYDTGRAVLYLAVDDVDAHHDRAIAAGARIIQAPVDQPYGSREYATLDPEDNVWSFGTYRPSTST